MVENIDIKSGWLRNRLSKVIWGAAAIILLLPLVAMQFTKEVTWDLLDFGVAGILLASICSLYELAARKAPNTIYQAASAGALLTLLLLIWINLAVGTIGSENNPANLLYIGVVVVGIIGVITARLKPHGMSRALWGVAITQILVTTIVLTVGVQTESNSSLVEILSINGIFTALWIASAILFRKAGMRRISPNQ